MNMFFVFDDRSSFSIIMAENLKHKEFYESCMLVQKNCYKIPHRICIERIGNLKNGQISIKKPVFKNQLKPTFFPCNQLKATILISKINYKKSKYFSKKKPPGSA